MRIYKDIPYIKSGNPCHLLDLYLPDGECQTLFLFFHGGGLVEGNRTNDVAIAEFTKDMTDAGIGVASAEYRLYPEARFPDFIEDAAAAVKFVKCGLSEYVSYEKLVVGGSSAGAYMTQMLCFNRSYYDAVGIDPSLIDAYVHDAGQPTVHFNVLKERGLDSRRIIVDEAAPIYHVGAEDYPPMLFIISDNDIENRLEETELLIGTIRRFGNDMSKVTLKKTSGNHVWYTKAIDKDGKSEYANLIIPFIKNAF